MYFPIKCQSTAQSCSHCCRGAYIEKDTGALVCTIEKANQLVGRMMEEQSLGELGALVVDELHMVADDDRCVVLEVMSRVRMHWQYAYACAYGLLLYVALEQGCTREH